MIELVVLVDDTPYVADMEYEHGLSMAIHLPEGLWLWDAGGSGAVKRNGARLGVDFAKVRGIALSHGHYDHNSGLPALRAAGVTARIWAHPRALLPRYKQLQNGGAREIGWRGGLEDDALLPVQGAAQLTPHCSMFSDIPRREGCFQAIRNFYDDAACTVPDTVPDDAALVVHGERGPALVLGCCHSGLVNTLEEVRRQTGLDSLHTVIGGLHLAQGPHSAVDDTVEALRAFDVRRVFAGHCTGGDALTTLRRALSGRCQDLGAGRRIEL